MADALSGEKGQFYPVQADVTKEEDILRVFAWIKEHIGPVHILVNNAGIFKPMSFSDLQIEDAKSVFDINVLSLCMTIREVLKVFKENDINGHIININSIAGHTVYDIPNIGVHTASKFAVTALTESLFLEMKRMKLKTKVTVSYHENLFINLWKRPDKNQSSKSFNQFLIFVNGKILLYK